MWPAAPAPAGLTVPFHSPASPRLLTASFPDGYKSVIRSCRANAAVQALPNDLLLSARMKFRRSTSAMDIIRIILSIIAPPIGVFLQVGFRGPFFLNILLTLLGYVPGIIHALYVIIKVK